MKFNTQLKQKLQRKTRNLAGGQAFGENQKLELVSILLTSFLEDKFYRSGDATVKRLRALVSQIGDKRFVAKAALYARNEAGMRSVSHLVAADLAHQVKGAEWTKRFFARIARRPDDVLEVLACYLVLHGKPLPNSLKKGLGSALARFDAYQLAKYRRGGAELKLVDAVNLLHPPHSEALGALVSGTLAPAETWETKLTQAGQSAESDGQKQRHKGEAWPSWCARASSDTSPCCATCATSSSRHRRSSTRHARCWSTKGSSKNRSSCRCASAPRSMPSSSRICVVVMNWSTR